MRPPVFAPPAPNRASLPHGRLGIVMVVVDAIAAVLGVVAFNGVQLDWLDLGNGGIGYPLLLGIIILIGFSVAASITSIPRYYLYGSNPA